MNTNENLELNTISALAGERAPTRFKQGDLVFHQDDIGDKLFAVVSGEVQLSWGGDRVEVIGPGSCVGVGALVDPQHRRFGTAVALSDSELLEISREQFLFAIQELPMFGLEMLNSLEQRLQKLKQQAAGR